MKNKIAFVDFYLPKDKWSDFIQELRDNGFFVYFTRHDDDGNWASPVTVKWGWVMVNRCGFAITKKEVDFTKDPKWKELQLWDVQKQFPINIGNDWEGLDLYEEYYNKYEINMIDVETLQDVKNLFEKGWEW